MNNKYFETIFFLAFSIALSSCHLNHISVGNIYIVDGVRYFETRNKTKYIDCVVINDESIVNGCGRQDFHIKDLGDNVVLGRKPSIKGSKVAFNQACYDPPSPPPFAVRWNQNCDQIISLSLNIFIEQPVDIRHFSSLSFWVPEGFGGDKIQSEFDFNIKIYLWDNEKKDDFQASKFIWAEDRFENSASWSFDDVYRFYSGHPENEIYL